MTSTLVFGLTLTLATAVPAGVVFTGEGSPVDVGYRLDGTDIFDQDTPSGILHQNADNGNFGRWQLDPSALTDELDRAKGWFLETRLVRAALSFSWPRSLVFFIGGVTAEFIQALAA